VENAQEFQFKINSYEFQDAIFRILHHEESKHKKEEISKKIDKLAKFQVIAVQLIESRFIHKNGFDLTLHPEGSLCLLNDQTTKIYIAKAEGQLTDYSELLTSELNRYLGNAVHDTLVLHAILCVAPAMISKKLDQMKIREYSRKSEKEAKSIKKNYSGQVSESDLKRLILNPFQTYYPNEFIVWEDDLERKYYGKIIDREKSVDNVAYYSVEAGEIVTISTLLLYKYKGYESKKEEF
jgi:hypothetical protein